MKRKISWYLRPTIFFKYFFQGRCQNKSNTITLSGTSNFCNFKTSQNGSKRQSIASCFFWQSMTCRFSAARCFPTKKVIPAWEQNVSIHQIRQKVSPKPLGFRPLTVAFFHLLTSDWSKFTGAVLAVCTFTACWTAFSRLGGRFGVFSWRDPFASRPWLLPGISVIKRPSSPGFWENSREHSRKGEGDTWQKKTHNLVI